jgi:hypothetical protein
MTFGWLHWISRSRAKSSNPELQESIIQEGPEPGVYDSRASRILRVRLIKSFKSARLREIKKAPRSCRAFSYLVRPEPEPDGAMVDPLGEALGPREFPDGL